MAGAELLGLLDPVRIEMGEGARHGIAAVAVDDMNRLGVKLMRGVDDMLQKRPTRERVQHLWQRGAHAPALSGGEDDYGEAHGPKIQEKWKVTSRKSIVCRIRCA